VRIRQDNPGLEGVRRPAGAAAVRGPGVLARKVNEVIKLVTGEDASFTDPQMAGQRGGPGGGDDDDGLRLGRAQGGVNVDLNNYNGDDDYEADLLSAVHDG
jgi:hypothetical protein